MALIHLSLQGKGGVGKSVVSALLAQYLRDRDQKPMCIDTDPVNATLASYRAFDVHRFELMDGDEVDRRKFDELLEQLTSVEADGHVVMDNGASTFVPLSSYLLRYEVPALLQEMGHTLVVHVVVTGGKAQDDTLQGLASILHHYDDDVVVVPWLNHFFGTIEHQGRQFEEMGVYTRNQDRLPVVVSMPVMDPLTTGDFELMLKRAQTFKEACDDSNLLLMQRRRLKMLRDAVYERLDDVGLTTAFADVA